MQLCVMHVTVVLFAVLLFINCPAASAQCAQAEAMGNFSGIAYEGLWYQYAMIPNPLEYEASCMTATYTASEDDPGMVWDWVNRMYNDNMEVYQTMNGTARLADNSGDGKLLITLPFTVLEANYWVLASDYITYALVFGCNVRNDVPHQSSWMLTRDASPTSETVGKLYEAVVRNNIDPSEYILVRQDDNCQYV